MVKALGVALMAVLVLTISGTAMAWWVGQGNYRSNGPLERRE